MITSTHTKPTGLSAQYADQFQDLCIASTYRYRKPYPPQVFSQLLELAGTSHPALLDIGCGTGDLTLGLSAFAGRIDAVDPSAAMLNEAQKRPLPQKNVTWIKAPAEVAPLKGPYDLVTAAQSLHWMDWAVLFARLKTVLKPGGYLAIVERDYADKSWWTADFQTLITHYSTNQDFQKYDLVDELQSRGLFKVAGDRKTEVVPFEQTVPDLIEAFHSRNGFSRNRMTNDDAERFDQEAHRQLSHFATNDKLSLGVIGRITWGSLL